MFRSISRSRASATVAAVATVCGLASVLACATSPTGRRQLMLYSQEQMAEMGAQSFEAIKSEQKISTDPATNAYVRCVTDALRQTVDVRWQDGWEVVVFEDPTANAFALPGRKIGVHTGLLEVARTQDQLAAVIGHEIGHVLAGHSNERVSQNALAQTGMGLAGAAVNPNSAAGQSLLGALGVGAQYGVLLPFSRKHESEADEIGLTRMAQAGFEPAESVTLWQNMESAGGQQPPEWMSTHPSHGTRIADLRAGVPEANARRDAARADGRRPKCVPPR